MLFSVLVSIFVIALAFYLDYIFSRICYGRNIRCYYYRRTIHCSEFLTQCALVQKIAIIQLKDNVAISPLYIIIEIGIDPCSFLLQVIHLQNPNKLVTDICSDFITQRGGEECSFAKIVISNAR